jgi:hypothetical protein
LTFSKRIWLLFSFSIPEQESTTGFSFWGVLFLAVKGMLCSGTSKVILEGSTLPIKRKAA